MMMILVHVPPLLLLCCGGITSVLEGNFVTRVGFPCCGYMYCMLVVPAKQQWDRLQQNCQEVLHRIRYTPQFHLGAEAGYHHSGLPPTCDCSDQGICIA